MARPVSSLALVTAFLAGCGTGDETDSYRLVPVSGHVTLDGKPLEGAKVLFTPSEANRPNTPGVDVTGQEGNYQLMYRGRSGVAPGSYQVFVAKTVDPAALKISDEFKDDPVLAAMEKQEALITQKAKSGGRTTASFNVSSSFDRDVTSKGAVFDFDLKATGKKK
ncbi:hypothetical protein SAMN05444166_3623 [Singulisphaera sp. GP187]|uniref:hypothetical protein n=1 Tax=Singulisphaera sp. GP187 TaxID=1882752 RepID=UPI00092B7C20|nr:hypothetical protein [Singulisphaera sp. GP187]SIO30304.1 hypothetical protein SAMN05444166_3623 [Singulisphaera sp. GP187]